MKKILFVLLIICASIHADIHLSDDVLLNKAFNKKCKPYLLPEEHSITPLLDVIFSKPVTQNGASFEEAGFITLEISHANFLRVAIHPDVPGYLFKIYLEDELRTRNGKKSWECLTDRCIGAENIRKLIRKKNLRHFVVPDKWLYALPETFNATHPVVLVETYFELTGFGDCLAAWAQADKKIIDELYTILSHGYASAWLVTNIPYTKQGKFACIDTEFTKRKVKYKQALQFFSPEMQTYWKKLTR